MKIGLFDSGVGGLTLLHEALRQLPKEHYLYYADEDHVPYGEKSIEEIRAYSDAALHYLVEKGCEAVVVACNTATSAAVRFLRGKYDIPVLGVEPAVKPAVEQHPEGRILVIATPLTCKEKKLHDLVERVDDKHRVDMLALPELVTYAERREFDTTAVRAYLSRELGTLDTGSYTALVFGCTHFNHFREVLKDYFPPELEMMDGSEGTIRHLRSVMQEKGAQTGARGCVEYIQSGRAVTDPEMIAFYESFLNHLG